jgi:hypothetical protein
MGNKMLITKKNKKPIMYRSYPAKLPKVSGSTQVPAYA